MPLYRVTDIVWDLSGEHGDGKDEYGNTPEELGLPLTAYVNVKDEEADDCIADMLSDEFGFCIKSLDYEITHDRLVFAG